LQFRGDTALLGKIAGIEPGAAQFLDARAVGPAAPWPVLPEARECGFGAADMLLAQKAERAAADHLLDRPGAATSPPSVPA
jgi:hypothetical protein